MKIEDEGGEIDDDDDEGEIQSRSFASVLQFMRNFMYCVDCNKRHDFETFALFVLLS